MRALAVRQFLLVGVSVLAIHHRAVAQGKARTPVIESRKPPNETPIDDRRLQLDRDRLEFDREKFESDTALAREKLQQDESHEIWAALGTLLPFLAGFCTLAYSVWSFRRQAIATAVLQKEAATLQFEMKAAEIAFAGKTPTAVQNRAQALKKVFGDRLPASFPAPLDVDALGEKEESSAEKLQFLELLLKYPDRQRQAFELWKTLFEDEWLDRVEPIVGSANPAGAAAPVVGAPGPTSTPATLTPAPPPLPATPSIPSASGTSSNASSPSSLGGTPSTTIPPATQPPSPAPATPPAGTPSNPGP